MHYIKYLYLFLQRFFALVGIYFVWESLSSGTEPKYFPHACVYAALVAGASFIKWPFSH